MNTNNAPIIIFAFNRLGSLKKTIESLLDNEEAKDCDLYVFVDGPRKNHLDDKESVLEVQTYVHSINGFNNVEYTFSAYNKGLGQSIIDGVSKIINRYGKVIVIEDDLIVSKNFLSYMNQSLVLYEKEKEIFSVCGYSNKIKRPSNYQYDAYFCTRSSSWGWGTWIDRWNSVDWNLKDWDKYSKTKKAFNKWGGSDCWKMLNDWHKGKNKSWAIRFCFSQFLQNKLSLFPIISKVANNGFDGSGTNCKKWSRFKSEFDRECYKKFLFPTIPSLNPKLYRSAMSYHTVIRRIYSRIMYYIYE